MTSIDGMRRRVSDACWSDLQIDAWLAAELAGEVSTADPQKAHLDGCSACAERVAKYREGYAQFAAAMPLASMSAATLAAVAERGSRRFTWQRLVPAFGLMAAVGAAALLLVPGKPGEERVKGGPSYSVHLQRGHRVELAKNGGEFRAGDRLAFRYSTDRPRHFALFSLETSGRVNRFVPAAGESSLALEPGSRVTLREGIELDDAVGTERLWGLFCDASFALPELEASLSRHMQDPDAALPDGCTGQLFVLVKK